MLICPSKMLKYRKACVIITFVCFAQALVDCLAKDEKAATLTETLKGEEALTDETMNSVKSWFVGTATA